MFGGAGGALVVEENAPGEAEVMEDHAAVWEEMR